MRAISLKSVKGMIYLLCLTGCLLVKGCASSHSVTQVSLRKAAESRLERVNLLLARGAYLEAYEAIQYDLFSSDPEMREPALRLVQDTPDFFDHVLRAVDTSVSQITTLRDASSAKALVRRLAETPSIDQHQVAQLSARLDARVAARNLDSSIPFLLSDDLKQFPSLDTSEGMRVIFERSLTVLTTPSPRGKSERALLAATLRFVELRGAGSDEYRELAQALSRIPLSHIDLKGQLAQLYPDYASQAMKDITLTILIETVPPKRLLEEDVTTLLKSRSPLLTFVREPSADGMRIIITELQYEERVEPERTQTAVVSYTDMNALVAVLMVPRGASFLYDVTQGGAEIQFAYEVKAMQYGQSLVEKIIREKVGDTYYACSNPRVQNVYGGLSRAEVWPNAQVESLCQRGGTRTDVTHYRRKIPERLAAEIASIPAIAKHIALSQ